MVTNSQIFHHPSMFSLLFSIHFTCLVQFVSEFSECVRAKSVGGTQHVVFSIQMNEYRGGEDVCKYGEKWYENEGERDIGGVVRMGTPFYLWVLTTYIFLKWVVCRSL